MKTLVNFVSGGCVDLGSFFVIAVLVFILLPVTSATAQQVLFDFDNAPNQTSLPIDQTVSGITAHFSATGQGYSIQNAGTMGFTPPGFSGRCIYPNSIYLADLLIRFDQPLTEWSIMYSCQELGCDDAATMRVTAYRNGTLVGTNTKVARFPGTWPVDTLACSFPQGFDSVVVHYDHRPPTCQDYGVIYLADNMRVTPLGALYHTIVASAGAHGSISPTGNNLVPDGFTLHFSIVPDIGYHTDSLLIDDVSVTPDTGYTFNSITNSHSIRAVFAINTYQIVAAAGTHGTITPLGQNIVAYGDSLRFSILPDSGYYLDSLIVDGVVNIDSTSGYTFRNVTADHQISATFIAGVSSVHVILSPRWNMVSLPLAVTDSSKTTLFPTAISSAFAYEGTYVIHTSLQRGQGYWLDFPALDTANISGVPFLRLDIPVAAGWNLIGGISTLTPVSAISLSSHDMVMSQLFGYHSGYSVSAVLEPGKGYWVKVNMNGVLTIVSP